MMKGDVEDLRRKKAEMQKKIVKGGKYPRKKKRSVEVVWTLFYINKIPEKCKNRDFWDKFASYRRMRDAFVPNKKDENGNAFGFIRFAKVEDVEEMEAIISKTYLGSLKVNAKVMLFSRGNNVGWGVRGSVKEKIKEDRVDSPKVVAGNVSKWEGQRLGG
ncbi:hypothetical protein QVD17_20001 [Tagetes erecta]|uniref:RRM domain-containing protein n=1 Tax=Tagetes erecta TaxID=13708 RepID=A0AAD8NXH0_TARER|nr:hypothetical protein QVD17_20001 [Tagetes erecta]